MQNTLTRSNCNIPFIQVLFVHYGRFNSDNSKVNHDISGNKVLILHEQNYHLVGVLVHDGSPNSGHYFSITVCPTTGKAYLCDDLSGDEYPRLISEAMLETAVKSAFMLVFERQLNPTIRPTARKRKSESERDAEQVSNKSIPEQLNEKRPPHEPRTQQEKADDLSAKEEEKEREGKDWKKSESAEESVENGNNKEEQAFCALVKEYEFLRSIPHQKHTAEQKKKYCSVAKKISRTKSKFPHIEVKKSAMTESEKKVAQRQKQGEKEKENEKAADKERKERMRQKQDDEKKEKETAAAKERMERMRQKQDEEKKEKETAAAKERMERMRQKQDEKEKEKERDAGKERKAKMRQNQDEKRKEVVREDDRQRKTAKKAGVTNKPRDGLKAELVLCGKFGVETNSLGKMDQVLNTLIIMKMKHSKCSSWYLGVRSLWGSALRERNRQSDVLYGRRSGIAEIQEARRDSPSAPL